MGKVIPCPYCKAPLSGEHTCPQCGKDFGKTVEENLRGELTSEQLSQQGVVETYCMMLIKEFAPEAAYASEQIGVIRDALIQVLERFHGIKPYDVYPWLLEPRKEASDPPRVIEVPIGKSALVKAQLTERVDEWVGPINVEVLVSANGIEVKVPGVETFHEDETPILIEQANGNLHLVAWDRDEEDPILQHKWPVEDA